MLERGLFLLTAGVGAGKTSMTIAVVEELAEEFSDELAAAAKKGHNAFDVATFYGGGGNDDLDAKGRIMSRISCMRMLLSHPDQLITSGEAYLADMDRHASSSVNRVTGWHHGVTTASSQLLVNLAQSTTCCWDADLTVTCGPTHRVRLRPPALPRLICDVARRPRRDCVSCFVM